VTRHSQPMPLPLTIFELRVPGSLLSLLYRFRHRAPAFAEDRKTAFPSRTAFFIKACWMAAPAHAQDRPFGPSCLGPVLALPLSGISNGRTRTSGGRFWIHAERSPAPSEPASVRRGDMRTIQRRPPRNGITFPPSRLVQFRERGVSAPS